MKERPILFNGEMVRAILNGSKTQTRRLVHKDIASAIVGTGENVLYRNPFGKAGDRLWVRETFVQGWDIEPVTDRLMQFDDEGNELPKKTWYRATDSHIHWSDDDGWETNVPWKPSIHMPRLASRMDLEITNIWIEPVQEITEDDAEAEGCNSSGWTPSYSDPDNASCSEIKWATEHFAELWNSIYKNWDENPWVWCVEFKRIYQ